MRAELLAVLEALSFISSVNANKIIILTDSKSALQHLVRCIFGRQSIPIPCEALKLLTNLDIGQFL